MKTILVLICSYSKEGCDFKDEVGGKNEAGHECPQCLKHNSENPDEPVLVGKLIEAEYVYDKEE